MATAPVPSVWLVHLDVSDGGDLRVLITTSDPLVGTGLTALFSVLPGVEVIESRLLPPDLSSAVLSYRPDVAIWDPGFAFDTDLDVSALQQTGVPTLALLQDESALKEAWDAGARAFLFRNSPPEHILSALFAVRQGLVVLAPEMAVSLLPLDAGAPAPEPLTSREEEVIALLAEGLPNKLIAGQLGISEHTVKYHVASILGKLGAQSRTEAVIRAARLGLIMI